MSQPKVVKRYANRKLYDTERSCYVTLDDIAAMIRSGEDVQVVDNKSGEDLTKVTLAQIIFETEKKNSVMPLNLLRGLIQDGGGAISEFYQSQVDTVRTTANELRTRTERIQKDFEGKVDSVTRVFNRRGEEGAQGTGPDQQLTTTERHTKITDLLERSRLSFEELQRNVEQAIRAPVGAVSRYAHMGRELDDIRSKLEQLETRLQQNSSDPSS